jgi:hypothetical protein
MVSAPPKTISPKVVCSGQGSMLSTPPCWWQAAAVDRASLTPPEQGLR